MNSVVYEPKCANNNATILSLLYFRLKFSNFYFLVMRDVLGLFYRFRRTAVQPQQ